MEWNEFDRDHLRALYDEAGRILDKCGSGDFVARMTLSATREEMRVVLDSAPAKALAEKAD